MDIVIGTQLTTRELKLDVTDEEGEKIRAQIDDLFSDKSGTSVLWITDKEGRTVGVPADKLAYVEIGSDKSSRPVGFSAAS